MKLAVELFGWYGAVAIVLSYALVSFSYLEPTSMVYQLLNVTGALGIGVVSFYKKAYQLVVLNIIWTVIALVAILNIIV